MVYNKEYIDNYKNKNRKIKTGTEYTEFLKTLKEHNDIAGEIEDQVEYMEDYRIKEKELALQLKLTKAGKAAGPYKIKPEMIIAMEQNETCKTALLDALN